MLKWSEPQKRIRRGSWVEEVDSSRPGTFAGGIDLSRPFVKCGIIEKLFNADPRGSGISR